jgi:lysophospholipase L1-like esterase
MVGVVNGMKKGLMGCAVAVTAVALLALCAELVLRVIYFHRNVPQTTAIGLTLRVAAEQAARWRANRAIQDTVRTVTGGEELPEEFRKKLHRALYTDAGRALLAQFQQEYTRQFEILVRAVTDTGAKLIVLYLPSDNFVSGTLYRRDACRGFYRQICVKSDVEFVDLTDVLLQFPVEQVTLLPENGHLSRYGNQLVARHLALCVGSNEGHRATATYETHPALLGDLKPSMNEVWQQAPNMPYRVTSNSQGFRMAHAVTFPKTRPRILVLGDSFTFGPYLNDHDCYPSLMARLLPEVEVINGGVAGYTINDEADLFLERARYAEPDLVILQVLDNDLYDLFYFQKNVYARSHGTYSPTPAEVDFFDRIRNQTMETTP